jgi:8-oxo-dGTP diphosphatase
LPRSTASRFGYSCINSLYRRGDIAAPVSFTRDILEKRRLMAQREYPLAPIVGVGAVVIEQDRVLLVRRNRQPMLGQWSVPGGAVELGETLEDAIRREVAEETGLSVAPIAIIKTFDRIERDAAGRVQYHYILVDFLCRLADLSQSPQAASDVSDACWVPLGGLRQSKEFILPVWTMEVIEGGQRQATGASRS